VVGVAAGVLAYTLAGFLLAPQMLERKLQAQASAHGLARVAIERISVNPFSFRVVLTGTRLTSADGQLIASLPRIDARLAAGSVFGRSPVVRKATVERPEIRMVPEDSGNEGRSFNAGLGFFASSLLTLAPERVEHLALSDGGLLFGADERASSPPDEDGIGFSVEVRDFGSASRARYTAEVSLPDGAHVHGAGVIVLSDRITRLEGDFELRDIGIESTPTGERVFSSPRIRALGVEIDQATNSTSVTVLQIEQPDLFIARLASGQIDLPGWLVDVIRGTPSALAAVERIEMTEGSVAVIDQAVTPEVSVPMTVTGALIEKTLDGPTRRFQLEGRMPGSGIARIEAAWRPSDGRTLDRLNLDLTDIDLDLLSPYFQAVSGRALDAGRLELILRIDQAEAGAGSRARLLIKDLETGGCEAGFSGEHWPLGRSVALLQDRQGRIELSLVAERRESTGAALNALVSAMRDRLDELNDRPFDALAEIAGAPGEALDRLPFEPGRAELSSSARLRLEALARALTARPAVALQIAPAYDPNVDRRALAAQQVRLHITLATSARPSGRSGPVAIDFDSDRVRSVLDEFGAERLSPESLQSVSQRFPETGRAYYQALFNRLVDNEAVSDSSLRRLAGFRAQTIVNALLQAGVEEARVRRSEGMVVLGGGTGVVLLPMEVVLAETQPCM